MNHGWEKKRLGDVCQINFGKRIVAKDTQSGPYYVYGGGGATFTTKDYNRENCMIVSRFAMSPECVRFVRGRFFLNDSGLSVDSITDSLTQEFVDKYLWANQPRIYNLGRGAAQRNLNTKSFSDFPIPIPPMEEQEQIVGELDKLSELIEIKRKQLKDLDALAQSLFYETFGDPIENPKGWETRPFFKVCKLSAGGDKPIDTEKTATATKRIPVFSNGVEKEGLYGFTSIPKVNEPSITISGRGTLGIPFIRKTPFTPIIRLIVATPGPEIGLHYLYHLLKTLKLGGKGAAIPQLTVPMIKDKLLPVPPIELQNEFAERIDAIEEQKRLIESSIADLETLLASRMDYWFND